MFHRTSPRGNGFVRSSKRRLGRAAWIEGLEQRCLLTIDNPLIVPIAPLPTEGIALGVNSPLVAHFASPAAVGNLSASVAFPSGTTTATVTANGATETVNGVNVPEFNVNYTGNWTPPDESAGVAFTVTIIDSTAVTGNTTLLSGATAVKDAALTANGGLTSATVTEGAKVNYTGALALMTFVDANPSSNASDFSANIDWGDGSPNSVGVVSQPGGIGTAYAVSGTHIYLDSGGLITVQVSDKGGSSASHTTMITVNDAALSDPAGVAITGNHGEMLNNVLLGTFKDQNPFATPADYTTSVDWGDGSPLSIGAVSLIGGNGSSATFGVYGSHTYAVGNVAPFAITVGVTDEGGSATTINATAAITPSPLTGSGLTVNGFEGRSSTFKIAKFTSDSTAAPADFTASIDWGDGHTTAGTIVADASGQFHVNGSHAYEKDKSSGYSVKVTVDRAASGQTILIHSTAKIAESPLDKGAGVTTTASKNVSFSNKLLGTFRDQNALNTSGSDYSGTIDWGDGTKSAAKFVFNGATANVGSFWKITGSHKYTSAKTFTVKITFQDTPSQVVTVITKIKVS